jgi:microcystin-dependent protein
MELYISTIVEMPLHWTPEGMMFCDGTLLEISHHPALYSLVGTYYGGDGVKTFALPDLRPVNEYGVKRPWENNELRKMIVVDGIYPPRP